MTLVTLLRHAWMDLLSAAIFLAVFLMRGYFEHETLSALLLWPVLFESMLVFALVLATMGNGITRAPWRNAWFAAVALAFIGLSWLGGQGSGLPWLWLAAIWLLWVRLAPPVGLRWLGPQHRQWLLNDGMPIAIMVWMPAFFAYLILIAMASGDCTLDTAGERHCKTPAWTFAVVWVPYFVIEALVRAGRAVKVVSGHRA